MPEEGKERMMLTCSSFVQAAQRKQVKQHHFVRRTDRRFFLFTGVSFGCSISLLSVFLNCRQKIKFEFCFENDPYCFESQNQQTMASMRQHPDLYTQSELEFSVNSNTGMYKQGKLYHLQKKMKVKKI